MLENPGCENLYSHVRQIPFCHADRAGIVYTPRFSDYCLEAFELWLKAIVYVDWYELNQQGESSVPVLHFDMDFISPLVLGDDLNITIYVTDVGDSSFSLSLTGDKKQGNVWGKVFVAKVVLSFRDEKTLSPASISNRYRKRIINYQETGLSVVDSLSVVGQN